MKLEPEYQDAFNSWQLNPGKATMGKLLDVVNPVLTSAVRTYATDLAGSPTMHSRARVLAVDSMKTYDPNKGSLRSHLLTNLQRLRRQAGQERQIISIPEQVARDQMMVSQATNALAEKQGRPPSDQELAKNVGLSVKRLHYIRQGTRPVAESAASTFPDAEGGPQDPASIGLKQNYMPGLEFLYPDMDATSQYIMERSFGMHGHKQHSPGMIARQLKLSPAAVSHRMSKIQSQIDQLEELGGI